MPKSGEKGLGLATRKAIRGATGFVFPYRAEGDASTKRKKRPPAQWIGVPTRIREHADGTWTAKGDRWVKFPDNPAASTSLKLRVEKWHQHIGPGVFPVHALTVTGAAHASVQVVVPDAFVKAGLAKADGKAHCRQLIADHLPARAASQEGILLDCAGYAGCHALQAKLHRLHVPNPVQYAAMAMDLRAPVNSRVYNLSVRGLVSRLAGRPRGLVPRRDVGFVWLDYDDTGGDLVEDTKACLESGLLADGALLAVTLAKRHPAVKQYGGVAVKALAGVTRTAMGAGWVAVIVEDWHVYGRVAFFMVELHKAKPRKVKALKAKKHT